MTNLNEVIDLKYACILTEWDKPEDKLMVSMEELSHIVSNGQQEYYGIEECRCDKDKLI